ncbi:DUF6565 domain-containing protein [Flavitalea sp.]|nr:DUF6565 domain-containing protein [Flavitalea sp.]
MKISKLVAATFIVCFGFTACNSIDSEIERDLSSLDAYLDSVKSIKPVYSEERWAEIKTEYNRTIDKVQVAGKELSNDANKKLEEVKAEYNKLKDEFEVHIADKKKEAEANDYKANLRKSLFGEEQVGTDMQFTWVTGKNALPVYDRFVNTVKENRDKYSREDWDEIKTLYEALDTRKNEIEKDLPSSDNLKIAKLKVQFSGLKAVRRPASKIGENEKAKDDKS